MTIASHTVGRRRLRSAFPANVLTLPIVLTLAAVCGGCRSKQPEPVKPAVAAVAGGDVSDGIVEGLHRELEAARRFDPGTAERVKAVRPILNCVEALSANEWRAHFGYSNSSGHEIPVSVSVFNRFWPPPIGRAQPDVFSSGTRDNVVQVTFHPRSSAAWVLGSAFAMADGRSAQCASTSLTVR